MHSPCKGSTAYTRSENLNEAEQERKSEFSVFPFVHLLWKLQTCLITCLCGRREDPPHWVRPKGGLAKCPLASNKCLHEKHKKERKYGEILHLIHSPDLPGSAIQGLPGCKGAPGPLCTHPCSDPLHTGKDSVSYT